MVRPVIALAWLAALAVVASPAAAQPLGSFRWQLQPFCNVITLTVVQQGGQYQLDGTDDQCGAAVKAGVLGLAFVNPNGSIGFALTIVQSNGRQVPIAATIALSTLSGGWLADGGGLFGPFVFTPGAGVPGAPFPMTSSAISSVLAGAGLTGGGSSGPVTLAVDFAATQQRVTGTCPSGQLMTGVQANGQVSCQSVTGAGGGDITAVTAGTGLVGGGPTGDVSLAVNFGGSGLGTAVARADHTHEPNNTRNIAIGSSALPVNTGIDNLAIGANAMQNNTTGGGNIAIGSFALRFGATTQSNIAIGQAALESTTGSRNTAVGYLAGRVNTSGADNVAVGDRALTANTTATLNTAVGSSALAGNTVGTRNTALGAQALQANVGGSNNTAVGTFALLGNLSGSSNTAAGIQALQANTTGSSNTALGRASLFSNLAGDENVAVGHLALYANTASSNTAVGYGALTANTTGAFNTAVGNAALDSNTDGTENSALGNAALTATTTGDRNVGIGSAALGEVGAGNDNIGIGYQAGLGLTSGGNNIYIGTSVGAATGGEGNTIRIGNAGATTTFIRGIHGATSSAGIGVFVNANGQLGTATSSARFKEAIRSLGETQHARLQALRPVSFVYTPEFDDGTRQIQYGLIAEEVAETFPELLVRDAEGRPQTVRYHLLTPLLLAEVQRLERERLEQAAQLAIQGQTLNAQATLIAAQGQTLTSAAADRAALEARVRALETALSTLLDRERQR